MQLLGVMKNALNFAGNVRTLLFQNGLDFDQSSTGRWTRTRGKIHPVIEVQRLPTLGKVSGRVIQKNFQMT